MTSKEFVTLAIKHSSTNIKSRWEWVKQNLSSLDSIFETDKYKQCDGYKHLCMPLLMGADDTLTLVEIDILEMAWYLNNEREKESVKTNYEIKMLKEGWVKLTKELIQKAIDSKKYIQISHFGGLKNKILKPSCFNGKYGLMPLRATKRCYSLAHFDDMFAKLVG